MRRPRPRNPWPRVYAQLIATGEIFEIARGEWFSPASYAALVVEFGSTWITWVERGPSHRGAEPEHAEPQPEVVL